MMSEDQQRNSKNIPNQGKFIVLEGGEGVGKSTNLAYVRDYLIAQNIDFIQTREPGGTPLAEEIRNILIYKRDEPVSAMAELLLVFAARAQHVETVIKPALQRGQWVLSDRFVDASYVYQGVARELGAETVAVLERLVLGSFKADKVIILDASLEVSQARATERGDLDRFESEENLFHERVRQAYLDRAASDPQRYAVVNAGQSLDKVQSDLHAVLETEIKSLVLEESKA